MASEARRDRGGVAPGGWRGRYRRLGRGGKIGVWVAATLLVAILATALGSYLFDGPLRRQLEARMNRNLHGYTVSLGHAHAAFFGLSLWLDDLVIRQQAHPEPPVASLPYLHLSIEWGQLLRGHLVGDTFFRAPQIHADLTQLQQERSDRISPRDRGWQQAFEAIFPLKVNRFRVSEGTITYVDSDPQRPLEITHWNLTATNIRNIDVGEHVYPSPVHADASVFSTGAVTIDGSANFLSAPYPGVHAIYRLRGVPLDRLQPLGERSNLELRGGQLTSHGEVEYSPRFKLVQVADIVLDGVRLDYVHSAATAAAERQQAAAVRAVAEKAEAAPLVLRLGRLHLTRGSVGYVNRAIEPHYRLFIDNADLQVNDLSNRAGQGGGGAAANIGNAAPAGANIGSPAPAGAGRGKPAPGSAAAATANLRGRFMGSGSARVNVTFRPHAAKPDFESEITIESASLPALNDMLRAYQKIDVAQGTISVYGQVAVKDGYVRGYIKPLIENVEVSDPQQDRDKPLGARLKEKIVGGLAHVLRNRGTNKVATRADISGPLDTPRTNALEIFSGLIRNAFFKAILPGLDGKTKSPAKT